MEAMIWKSEENSSCTRRRLNLSPAGSDVPVKCVKRRRREPSTVAGAGAEIARDQVQVDQSGGTTTTTTKRSSKFRGVSRHRWTGRFEAHLWDKGSWNATQKKKGKQVYLGAYDEEEAAARAYDLAALKYWGPTTFTNFPVVDYEKEQEIMQNVTREEYLASLRRKSSGFSRGVSKYRGVARHHHNGRWEARIGRVFGNKYLYLGTYSTQEEAAAAYDIAAIEYRGMNAVTNFDLSTYIRWLRPGANNLVSPQEQQSISQNGSLASIINIGQHKESDPYLNQISLPNFMLDDLINSTYMKQELGSTNNKLGQMPSNNSLRRSSSSPALSLLFRSSVFRELLEKNPNASECETDQEDDKLQLRQHMENSRADVEFQGMFYDGIADHFPFLCGGNGGEDVVPGLDLEDRDRGKQCFDRPSQSIWSSILNMSSIQ